ncbi:MAG TPA: DMT family transporter [Candidatus Saccharimonadales bacterium]|nr:DMT family transporter [Candidatus Saccharimonadales bacterium]
MTQRTRADLALAFCTLLWGATFVVVKNALDHSSVFVFLAVRFTVAGILMIAFRPFVLLRMDREELFAGMRLGFFMFAGYAFQTAGLQYTTAANSGFVTGSSVVLVPVLLGLFWGKTLTRWVYAGSFAAVAGLYFLTVPVEGVAHLNRGDVLTFVAAGLYAVHIILVGEYTKQHSVSALSVIQVLACAFMAWVMAGSAAAIRWQPARFEWRWQLLVGVLVCAVLATAVAFTLQMWAQQYTSPSHAAILFTLEPVIAVLTSYILIKERLSARGIFGAVLIFAGILIAELLGPPATPESPEPVFMGRLYFKPWWK